MERLMTDLQHLGRIGANPDGSVTRLGFSPQHRQAVLAVQALMGAAGMETHIDPCGNLRGRLVGTDPAAGTLMLGSHLDTVPCGGLYDGAYGVIGAIEALRRIGEGQGTLRHTVEVWGFNMEESNPLGGTFGSEAVAGLVPLPHPGLEAYGLTAQDVVACRRDFSDVRCYLELHIEQGDRLDRAGLDIGIVSGIVSISSYRVTALGQSNHAGTTAMTGRRDALVAMSRLIVAAEQAARRLDDGLVFTVGMLEVHPGATNVIPGRVEAMFEMRHMDTAVKGALLEEIRALAAAIPTADFTFVPHMEGQSAACDGRIMDIIAGAARDLGLAATVMASGAGHDAASFVGHVPMGMIFVPSRDGISHSGAEYTSPRQLSRGVDVLARTLLAADAAL